MCYFGQHYNVMIQRWFLEVASCKPLHIPAQCARISLIASSYLQAEDSIQTLHVLKIEFRMASCFENFVKHMQLSIRQLKELNKGKKVCDVDLACDLMQKLSDLLMQLLS